MPDLGRLVGLLPVALDDILRPDEQLANAVVVATSSWQGLGDSVANDDYAALYSVILQQLLPTL